MTRMNLSHKMGLKIKEVYAFIDGDLYAVSSYLC